MSKKDDDVKKWVEEYHKTGKPPPIPSSIMDDVVNGLEKKIVYSISPMQSTFMGNPMTTAGQMFMPVSLRDLERRAQMYANFEAVRWTNNPRRIAELLQLAGECFELNISRLGHYHRLGAYRYEHHYAVC